MEGQKNPYDMTLMEHNFHSHFELKIEVREEGTEFAEWNENWTYIRPWTWQMYINLRQIEEKVDLSGDTDESKEVLDAMTVNVYDIE